MANLGTLWFGADVDLTALKKSIQEGNKDILNALKMDYDPQSFIKMVEKLQSELNNKTFNIQLSADGKSLTQAVGNIEKVVGNLGQAWNGGTIAPFDLKNIEGAAQGIAGMKGNVIDLSKQILDQRDKVHEWQNVVSKLREEWGKAVASGGRKSDAANAAYELYSGAREVLKQEREDLFKLTQQRGRATVALREMLLSEQLSQTESTTARQKYNAMLVETEKLLMRINDVIRNGGKTPLLDIASRDLSAFQTRAVLVDTKDVTAMSNLVSEFNRLSKVYGQVTTEAEKADKAYMKTVNDFTEQSKKAYAEREKAAAKASQTEKKSASDASAEWTRLEAIIARLNVLRDNALKAKVPTDGVDGLINKMKQLQSLYSEISLNNGRLSNGMLFKDLKGSANTKSAMHEISQVYTETNQKIRESNQLTRESEREAKAKAAAVSAAEKQIQREIDRSKRLYDDLTASIDRGKKASRDMSALESQQSRLNGQMMLLKNMTAADKENASLVEKRVKGIQDVRTETERLKKSEDELTRARERANKRNDNAALKNLKDEEKSVRDAWNRYEELKLKIREVEALKQRGVALKMDVSEIDSALARLKDLRWQMSDIINNGGRRSTGKKLLTSELWSDSGKRELLNANAEIKNFTANLRETEKESRQVDAGIKRLGLAFNELKGYIKQNGGSDEMRRLQSELQGAIQKMRQLMNAGDYKGAASVFERVSGNIRQAQVATRLYESSLRGASSGVSQLTEQERLLAASLKGSSDAMKGQSQVLGDLKTMAAQYLSVWGAKEFLSNIIEIGGQLENQRRSITAILGEAAYANDLFEKIQDLALKSPFGVVELDQYTKQLSAYGFQYHELFEWTKRLADISAGTGTNFSRLTLALGHVRSEMALTGYTLRQFAMGNIPMLQKLSENLGVTTKEIRKMVSEKRISYEDVAQVLRDLTDEGGMFYNMQEVMSESVKSRWKNLKDALDVMYGQMAEGLPGDALKEVAIALTAMAKRWEAILPMLTSAIGLFGASKLALMAYNRGVSANVLATTQQAMSLKGLTAAQIDKMVTTKALTREDLLMAVATKKLTVDQAELAAATFNVSRAQLEQLATTSRLRTSMTGAFGGIAKFANPWTAALVGVEAVVGVYTSYKAWIDDISQKVDAMVATSTAGAKEISKYLSEATERPDNEKSLAAESEEMKTILKNAGLWTKETEVQVGLTENLSDEYDFLLGKLNSGVDALSRMNYEAETLKELIASTSTNLGWADILEMALTSGNPIFQAIDFGTNRANGNNGGWSALYDYLFNDDIFKNAENLEKSLSKFKTFYSGISEYHEQLVETLREANLPDELKKQLDGQPIEEQLRILADSKYWDAFVEKGSESYDWFADIADLLKKNLDDVNGDFEEIVEDDIPKLLDTWMKQFGKEGKDFADWAQQHPEDAAQMIKELEKLLDEKGPTIANKIRSMLLPGGLKDANGNELIAPTVGWSMMPLIGQRQETADEKRLREFEESVARTYAANKKIGDEYVKTNLHALQKQNAEITSEWLSEYVAASKTAKEIEEGVTGALKKKKAELKAAKKIGRDTKDLESEIAKLETVKSYHGFTDSRDGSSDKERKQAEKDAKQREKVFEARMKEDEAQAKRLRELEDVMAELNVASIENRGERERAQEDLEHEKRLRQIQQQADEWKKEAYKLAKEKWDAANTDKTKVYSDTKEGAAGWQGVGLTDEQYKIYIANMKKAELERKRVLSEREKEDARAMLDYIKEFGTIQERRYAIQREYDAKIAEETRATQKMALEAEKKKALDAFDMEVLKTEIDWTTMFDGLGTAFEEEMKSAISKVESYMQSDAFKGLDAKDKSEYVKLRNELSDRLGGGSFQFGQIGKDMDAYHKALREAKDAERVHAKAVAELDTANRELKEAEYSVKAARTIEERLLAKGNLLAAKAKQGQAQSASDATGKAQTDALGNVIVAQGNLQRSLTETDKAVKNFSAALSGITAGTLQGFADGVTRLVGMVIGGNSALKKGLDGLGKNIGGLIGAILSIIDALGEDPSGFIGSIFDKIISVVDGLMEQLANGELVAVVIKGVGGIIASLAKGIANLATFGLFDSVFGSRGNEKEVKEATERLTDANERLKVSIDGLRDDLQQSKGIKAVKTALEAIEAQKKVVENQRDILWANQNYHAGHHSNASEWDLRGSRENWDAINALLAAYRRETGRGAGRVGYEWGDFALLSPEEYAYIRKHNAELWRWIEEVGNYDNSEYFDAFADLAGSVEDLTNDLKSILVGATPDDLFGDFLESLYDFADGSEEVMDDVAVNWQKMVNRMVINNAVASKFQDWLSVDQIDADGNKIESWYTRLANLQEALAKGWLNEDHYKQALDELMSEYNGKMDEAIVAIETFKDHGVIKSLEEVKDASKKYFEDLLDSWKSTLTDMSQSTEDWKDELIDQMLADLVEATILSVPVSVDVVGLDGGTVEREFSDFAAYLEDWTARYKAVMEDATLTDEERNENLKALINEQTSLRDEQAKKSKALAASLGKDVSEAFSNSLDNLGDTLLDTLLDAEKDAAQMGAEIGKTLVQEMLKEILASEKYAGQIAQIKHLWQNILKNGGSWTDEDGLFGDSGIVYTLDSVLAKIADLNDAISLDSDIQKLTSTFNDFDAALKQSESSFGNLHDTFMDAIFDMEDGAEDFSKTLRETLVKDLVERNVFGKSFEMDVVGLDGETVSRVFDDFAAYQKDWTGRYLAALKKGDEALLAELTKEIEERESAMAKSAEAYVKSLEVLSTPFDGLRSSFLSSLMDMESSTRDFAKSINEILTESFIDKFVLGDDFDAHLDYWQREYRRIMGDTSLDAEARSRQLQELKVLIADYREQMGDEAAAIHALMGTAEYADQDATMNMADKITFEQADMLLGINVAQHQIQQQILDILRGFPLSGFTETNNLLIQGNGHLYWIHDYMKRVYDDFGVKLDAIASGMRVLV